MVYRHVRSDYRTGRLMTSCSLLLVHTEATNRDNLRAEKLIKQKRLIPHVLQQTLGLQIGMFRLIYTRLTNNLRGIAQFDINQVWK